MRSGRRLLIEHQAEGDEYRLLFLDGTLLDAVRRRPPVLVGDGRSTVGELIEAENRHRWASRGKAGMRLIEVDLDCILTLRRAGMSLKSVPPAGSPLKIKSTTNVNGPGDNETVQDIGLELVVEARRAAALLGVRLAGVDVIAPDRRLPLRESGGVIVEVNGTPGIHYHYLVADRDHATRVAIPILSKLLGLA
jgi:cyanophycin synthetase